MTASATVYRGEILKVVAGGTCEAAAADAGIIVLGVAAEYKVAAASGTTYVEVWADPNIIFGIQSDSDATGTVAADIFQTANHVKTHSGSTTTYISGDELDASDIGTGAQLKVLGKIDTPDNDWGPNVDLMVIFNEHLFKAAVAGV
jgi:hypothetical protein